MTPAAKKSKSPEQSDKSIVRKTYSVKPSEVVRQWHLVNAADVPLGRLSTEIAKLLTGKHKPQFSPHIDCGDHVIVINSSKVGITGKKASQKVYYRHSQYPGSIKATKLEYQLDTNPDKVILQAVRGMLPKNKLQPERLKRLKVYSDENHAHQAQQPTEHKIQLKKAAKLER